MISRIHTNQVTDALAHFPAVALLGPRQCGKTTLARSLGGFYLDLETSGDQTRLDAEWDRLTNGDQLLVLDEAHQTPHVFARLRAAIDADRKRNGRFLILGSVSPSIMQGISESLAGRLATIHLSPLVLPEVGPERLDDLWLLGGFPDGGILDAAMFPRWQRAYLELLAARDLPNWGLSSRPAQTDRLLRMLAASHGQLMNASSLGASLGLDHKTLTSHCDYLEGAFLIRRLQPFFTNTRKRLVKSPRVYWRDTGLLHALMGVTSFDQLYHQPWLGASWEGFCVEQTIAVLNATGQASQPYFFRTTDGRELDLVLDWGTERWACEVKITSAPSRADIDRLHNNADLIDANRRILICRIAEPIENDHLLVTNLADWLQRLIEVYA